ncbi:Sat5 [Stachybotrys chartarum IBT 7711]|uniref:O-acetyltransferase SAT5 n=1 Tax=Stachybotrys chartarum (strain CBS 109288 / IBT 7711) TaxID=1280523 RepID=SAT5_STACB|nr:RecName: Full=O-acetyltransferase SAT5; AltName: Full=Satratoxin biosynthesis SC1 cluster protein 5 [Stachybotrys chartarum IBT 7711]KEY74372.1 Sat5 [Stachybotrys chartarum IBT 7711]
MSTMAKSPEANNLHQDVIAQFPILNGYTHTVGAFSQPLNVSRLFIIDEIQTAYDELRVQIPWLAHQVVVVDAGPGKSGYITTAPWPSSAPPNDVTYEEKDDAFPSLNTLIKSGGSFLATKDLVGYPGLPEPHGLHPTPVATIRLVFITGGVLVVLSTHHNIVDGIGLMQMWDYLDILMGGGAISRQDARSANADRARVLPLIAPGEPVKDYSHLIRPNPWPLPPPPKTEWRLFKMHPWALAEIRSRARDGTDQRASARPASSDDALTAFCWQRVSAMRLASGRVTGDQVSKFGRAVNGRSAMGLDSSYLFHMMLHTETRLPIEQIARSTLAELSTQLRKDLDAARTEWSVRSYATFLAGVADKTRLLYGGITNPQTDLGGTSTMHWASRRPIRLGLLGDCHLIRKPEGMPLPGCLYFMPSGGTSGVVQLLLCLPKEELDALQEDAEWKHYTESGGRRVDGPRL